MEGKKKNSKLRYVLFVVIAIILVQIWYLIGKYTAESEIEELEFPSAIIMDIPAVIPEFSLTDHNGKEFTKRNLFGRWTFMFFGYIHCPDVCPMGLVDLNDVYSTLEKEGKLIEKNFNIPTQVVFVSVDPERDTVEELKEYVPYFNEDFIGVTGSPEAIKQLADSMAVGYYRTGESEDGKDYEVNHTASFMLMDPLGGKRAVFPQPHEPEQMVEDFLKIREEFTAECCITPEGELNEVIFDYKEKKL